MTCPGCGVKSKIDETKLRSFLKALSFRIVEIIIDTILLSYLGLHIHVSLLASILIELICFLLGFSWERVWNKIRWGRRIIRGNHVNHKHQRKKSDRTFCK